MEDHLLLAGGLHGALKIDLNRLITRYDRSALAADLKRCGFKSPEALAGALVVGGDALVSRLGEEAPFTDDVEPILAGTHRPDVKAKAACRSANLNTIRSGLPEPEAFIRFGMGEGVREKAMVRAVRDYARAHRLLLEALALEAADRSRCPDILSRAFAPDPPWEVLIERAFRLKHDGSALSRHYAETILAQGFRALAGDRFGEARTLLSRAAALEPNLRELIALEGFLALASKEAEAMRNVADRMAWIMPFRPLTHAFRASAAEFEDKNEEAERWRDFLNGEGGLPDWENKLYTRTASAGKSEEQPNQLDDPDVVKRLLLRGPKGLLKTGTRAWSAVVGASDEVLDTVREALLADLAKGGSEGRASITALGFFQDSVVRETLKRAYEASQGRERFALLEALTRSGETLELVKVIEDPRRSTAIKLNAIRLAAELRLFDAAGGLIELLESDVTELRMSAFVALFSLSGVHFDYDPYGSAERRGRSAEAWREWHRLRIKEPHGEDRSE